MNPIYRLRGVRFSYLNRFAALNGIDLDILRASRVAFIGPNGSGKSTLLKLLDALYFAQEGTVEFEGAGLTEEKLQDQQFSFEFRRRVGFLFQDPEVQLFSPTVWDDICFGPLQLQWDKSEIREKAEQLLSQFGLTALRDRPPFRLSLGEKRKVALASVLILDPEVLLLDEPTSSLDPRTQSLLLELLQKWGGNHKTILSSTHDLTILREICDEVYVMQNGKLVYHDTPEKVLSNQPLLEETNLIHVHTHKHPEVEHFHPHTHDFHSHTHNKDKD